MQTFLQSESLWKWRLPAIFGLFSMWFHAMSYASDTITCLDHMFLSQLCNQKESYMDHTALMCAVIQGLPVCLTLAVMQYFARYALNDVVWLTGSCGLVMPKISTHAVWSHFIVISLLTTKLCKYNIGDYNFNSSLSLFHSERPAKRFFLFYC